MKRNIINIDQDLCNGCGDCVTGCPEGAIQLIDGKAKLVGELYCDGLGACIGACPVEAITIEQREAEEYDEAKTMENIIPQGEVVIKAHLKHIKDHGQMDYLKTAMEVLREKGIEIKMDEDKQHVHTPGGCPGTMAREIKRQNKPSSSESVAAESQLDQWPIQMHLVNPIAPYFKNADLLVCADCVPFAYANFHNKFLSGKKIVMFCSKLDGASEVYLNKLTEIIKNNDIKSITVVKMEVPCCGGTLKLTEEAIKDSGKQVLLKEYIISIDGNII